MNTMEETKKDASSNREARNYSAANLTAFTQQSLAGAIPTAVLLNYTTKGKNERIDSFGVIAVATKGLESSIVKMSKNSKKRLYNAVVKLKADFSLCKVNRLLKILHKVQEGQYELTLVDLSMKERNIQSARKTYTLARDAAKTAYAAYKKEKGDFYKQANKGVVQ